MKKAARFHYFIKVLTYFSFILSMGYLNISSARAGSVSKKLHLILSVDWEGDVLSSQNVAAIENFRNHFPQVKLVHFLNAAYFVKPGVREENVRTLMQRGIQSGDQLGLHIHGWQSLVRAAGVNYRNSPSFWHEGVADDGDDFIGDRGHDIFMGSYTVPELRKIIRTSIDILGQQGYSGLSVFRTGGWHLNNNVREALAAEGIHKDSSAVPTDLLREEIGSKPLYRELSQLWSNINIFSLPYSISTSSGPIMEYPNNTALADYVSGEEAFEVFKQIISNSNGSDIYLHYGFHHETATRYLSRVATAIQLLSDFAQEQNYTLEFSTLE